MTLNEIMATKLTNLVKRLFVIDSKLNGETYELVSEYNEIIEEIWGILVKSDTAINVQKGANIK